jgi:5-methylcytosine-specific restriction enzyme A
MLAPLVPRSSGFSVTPPAKQADPGLLTEQHKQWREQVLRSAGYRCEWIDNGIRCAKAAPKHRMFADHIEERQDGGAPYDPANGQCLCGSHHTIKTARARTARLRG